MMKARSLGILCAALLLLAAPASAQQKLRVGKAVTSAFTFVPLDVGMKAGIFKAHGLDIDEYNFGGSAKLQQGLAANSIDIGIGSGPELSFVAKGAPVLGVAAMAGKPALLCLVVAANGPVKTVADLKGKTVSSSTVASLTTWLVRELSRQQGWGPDGIKLAYLGEEPTQLAALRTGETQGATVQIAAGYRLEDLKEGRNPLSIRRHRAALHHSCDLRAQGAHRRRSRSGPEIPRRLVRDDRIHGDAQGPGRGDRGADHGRLDGDRGPRL